MASLDIAEPDYEALTAGCALVDRSERGKLALSGPQAAEFVNGQVTNDVEALAPGTGCYAAFLTPKGKMLGDLRILRTDEELLLDTERSSLQALFDLLRRATIGWQAELHKRTLETGLLSLAGPRAREVAEADAAGLPAEEHAHRVARIAGVPVRLVAAAGGVDVLCDAAATASVADALVARGARAVDEATGEIARIEAGRPRYGVDLDDTTIPEEAGLNERAVSFAKGCYIGQETVARLHWKGRPNRHLRGLRLSAAVPSGTPLRLGDREVGRVGSVGVSPRHGPIALALVRREARPGDVLDAGGASAEVAELPFEAPG
jgi:folate-binding protein YgfZ